MNTPPIPPIPEPNRLCQNCGRPVTAGATLCPHCGAALNINNASSGALRALRIIGAIILGLIALPLGASGACFMLFAFGSNDFSGGLGGAAMGFGLVAVAGLFIWGAIRLAK